MRRITHIDPADGSIYIYLTNELELPAYLLTIVFKKRWDIEWSGAT
ncbi:MAG: hypothetical protein HC845_06945 [Akkermansiaceae bacterium]|nr:hypothetical protein [Akkermansiaceae bacterium]